MENASAPAPTPVIPNEIPDAPLAETKLGETAQKDSQKKIVLVLLCIVLVLAGIAAGVAAFFTKSSLNPTSTTPTLVTSTEKVRVGSVGVYNVFNLIAQEKDLFQANGLDAEVTEFSSGPESLAALLEGKTDISVAADFVGVRNIFNNPDIRILAQVNQHRIFQLAAKKETLTTPADLKGKKIGVTKNSAGEYFLGNFLSDNELAIEDITMVDLTPVEMIKQVEAGTIDAMVVFEPHVYNLKKDLGDNFVSWDIQGDQNISALVYTKQSFIDEHPGVVKKYLQTLVDADEYYQVHVAETKKIAAQRLGYDQDYIEYSWPKLTHHVTLNQELLLGMEEEARWTIENKLTDKTSVPNYLNNIYLDGLSSVKPEAVTIIQ